MKKYSIDEQFVHKEDENVKAKIIAVSPKMDNEERTVYFVEVEYDGRISYECDFYVSKAYDVFELFWRKVA